MVLNNNLTNMITYNISFNEELATVVEAMIRKGKYANRSEFFRNLVRDNCLEDDECVIEELDTSDPDYRFIKEGKKDKNTKWIPIKDVAKEFNVQL